MEQKTEASQAVDDTVERGKFVTEYLRYMAKEAPQSHPEMVYSMAHTRWDGIAGVMWRAGRAALKAQPAPTEATAEPVMWFEAEASAKGQPLRHVIGSMLYSTRMHTTKPEVLNNALWPLYEHPAPTEAQGLSPVYAWLERSTRNSPSEVANAARTMMAFYQGAEFPEAAQGEDSARLDWLIENVSSGSIGFINGDFIGSQDFDELKVYIDRARASAETGGVKS